MKTRNFKSRLMIVIALLSVLFSTSIFAQAPEKMSYQAVVRNASNELIVNKQIGVLISITQGIFPPVSVYSETHIATTNSNGLMTLQLGGGKLVSGNFSTIKWENGNVSVSSSYDLSGGTNYSLLSSSQLLSVPYALYAKTAGNATGGSTCPDGTTVGEIKYWNGTIWITVAPSLDGKVLTLEGGVPVWKGNTNTTPTQFSISTKSITNISENSVKVEGFINGGNSYAAGGNLYWKVLYGLTPNLLFSEDSPIGLDRASDQTSHTKTIGGLTQSTKYYVRTCAIGFEGGMIKETVYGEEFSFTTLAPLALGDNFGGGIVAYILKEGDPGYDANVVHGLIAAPTDQSSGIRWDNGTLSLIPSNGALIGTGNDNTNSIVAILGEGNYAAKICFDLVLGGYNDWYLPSINELFEIKKNANLVAGVPYWSSSVQTSYSFYAMHTIGGFNDNTDLTYRVRAIRSF